MRSLAAQETNPAAEGLQALEELQKRIGLTEEKADDWVTEVRRERAEMERNQTSG